MEAGRARGLGRAHDRIEHRGRLLRQHVQLPAELAEANQARLTVVDPQPDTADDRVRIPGGVSADTLSAALAADSAELLRRYRDAAAGRVEFHAETRHGIGFVEVVRAVLGGGHDLVVKAAETPAAVSRLFGSLDLHLPRKCPVPVWIIKPGQRRPCRRVVAAVDVDPERPVGGGDSLNRRIVAAAAGQALAGSGELHVVHAWRPTFEGVLRSRGVFHDEGEAQAYIERERRAHASALDRLVAALDCAVPAVKPPGFRSPVEPE